MKKIVALVLCLVLALSLCTVAMADDKYAVDDLGHLAESEGSKFTAVQYDKGSEADDEFTTYVFSNDGVKDESTLYVICDAGSADFALVKNGKVVNYYMEVDATDPTWETTGTKVSYTDAAYANDEMCGTIISGSGKTFYKGADGKYYVADKDGDKLLKVGGVAVSVSDSSLTHVEWSDDLTKNTEIALYVIDHTVDGDVEVDSKTGKVSYEDIECAYCDKALDYVTSQDAAQAKWGVGAFHTADVTGDATKTIYVACALNTTAAADTTTDSSTTVESAKTFDAGIALYAGMALASVAGSAVVIGKKKEF